MMRSLPSLEVLQQTVDYDPHTGILTWRYRVNERPSWNSRHAGKPAINSISPEGYRRGYLLGVMTLAHRVAYAIFVNRTDIGFIDHINGDRADNRAINLREVSRAENAKNKTLPSNSTSGHIGVSQTYDGRWRAHITVNNKMRHLGRFLAIEDAIAARDAAELEHGFHPNHGRMFVGAAA